MQRMIELVVTTGLMEL